MDNGLSNPSAVAREYHRGSILKTSGRYSNPGKQLQQFPLSNPFSRQSFFFFNKVESSYLKRREQIKALFFVICCGSQWMHAPLKHAVDSTNASKTRQAHIFLTCLYAQLI